MRDSVVISPDDNNDPQRVTEKAVGPVSTFGIETRVPTGERDRPSRLNNAAQTNGRTHERTPDHASHAFGQIPGRPLHRQPERYAFQFWADQITRLKRLRQILNLAKDPDDRTEVALSDLVRTAVDDYLDRQTGRSDGPDTTG